MCEVLLNRLDDGLNRVVAALFERAEDAHQHGLAVGAALASVAVAVFAEDHRRADRSFGVVVVEGNSGLIEEREQVVLMPPEALYQASGVGVFPRPVDELGQPPVEAVPAGSVCLDGQLRLPPPQPDRVPHQSPQLLGEGRPMRARRLVLLRLFQLAQQMDQARLPRRARDRVVGAQKSVTSVPANSWMKNFAKAGLPRERSIR